MFAFVVFLSAFLLFQVQLIVAKHLLPWFGGTPAVWTTSQMFFQLLLLGGYTYAHLLTNIRGSWRQFQIHLAVLVAASVALFALPVWGADPLLAPSWLKPEGTENPVSLLLLSLMVSVGLPFFAVSTTGPLLQQWHSRQSASLSRTYRLYALSNAGSFLGLLSYPFGVERVFDLPQQGWLWAALFAVFAIGCGVVAWRAAYSGAPVDEAQRGLGEVTASRRRRGISGRCVSSRELAAPQFHELSHVPGDDESIEPGCRGGAISLGASPGDLSPDVHYLLRSARLVLAPLGDDRRGSQQHRDSAKHDDGAGSSAPSMRLWGFPVQCLHALPRRACAAAPRPSTADAFLSHHRVRRGRWRHFRQYRGAPMVPGPLGVSSRDRRRMDSDWARLVGRSNLAFHTGERWLFSSLVTIGSWLAIRYLVERTRFGRVDWIAEHGWTLTFVGAAAIATCVCAAVWRSRLARSSLWPAIAGPAVASVV